MKHGFIIIIIIIFMASLNAFSDSNGLQGNPAVTAESGSQSGGFLFKLSDSGIKRTVFVRMEKNAQLWIDITNDTGRSLSNITVKAKCNDNEIKSIHLSNFQNKEIKTIHIPVGTSVRPDTYVCAISVTADGVDIKGNTEHPVKIFIVNRKLPYEMPVVLWADADFKLAKSLGFTHCFLILPELSDDSLKIWNAKSPMVAGNSPNWMRYIRI